MSSNELACEHLKPRAKVGQLGSKKGRQASELVCKDEIKSEQNHDRERRRIRATFAFSFSRSILRDRPKWKMVFFFVHG